MLGVSSTTETGTLRACLEPLASGRLCVEGGGVLERLRTLSLSSSITGD